MRADRCDRPRRVQSTLWATPKPTLPASASGRRAALGAWYARWVGPGASFLREWWRNPGAVGAICPSSNRLAERMVQWVQPVPKGWVVELGGGTGTVTAALLRCGVPRRRLIVIERSLSFVRHLRSRFPGVAATGAALLVNTIVSGLPLRALPAAAAQRITRACARLLAVNGRLIQFTYALSSPNE